MQESLTVNSNFSFGSKVAVAVLQNHNKMPHSEEYSLPELPKNV